MVNSNQYIEHPLRANKEAATWWWLRLIFRVCVSVLSVVFFAAFTRQVDETAYLFLGLVLCVLVAGYFLDKWTVKKINYYTPGYMARFTALDVVKGHSPLIDICAGLGVSLLTVLAIYLFKPDNDLYSAVVLTSGWFSLITNLIRLIKRGCSLAKDYQQIQGKNFWFLARPAVQVLVVAPLYLMFPQWTGTPAHQATFENLLLVTLVGALILAIIKRFR